MIHIYNSLSGKKEPLPDANEQRKIRMFVCGPTVYDYLHIGNARTYIFFDFFAKYLRAQGYEVNYLQNITDIDDKIIKRAAEENKKPEEVAKFFTEEYLADMKALGVDGVTEYASATKFITQIIGQVERLIDKGFAYKIDGDGWYFDISKDEDYGKLSHRTVEQAEDSMSRIDEAADKRNKGDFCLWKFSHEGEPSWPGGMLGAGRPGWHIEDTAISEFYFGPQYEIHGGGVDLKFPHHEAEIAQQESASGLKPFVALWIHTGALLVESKKMSKSLGNFITIRDFLKKYPPEVLRLLVLKHHYRSPMDFSESSAEEAKKNLSDLGAFVKKLKMMGSIQDEKIEPDFSSVIHDDINTPQAIADIFIFMSQFQDKFWTLKDAHTQAHKIESWLLALNIKIPNPKISPKAEELAARRELSRSSKQFEESDRLRKEINDLGYEVEDTPRGSFLWPKFDQWQHHHQSNQN